MNTIPEPEGGKGLTTIIALDSSGNPARVTIDHNGRKYPTNANGRVSLYINGGDVLLHGIPITRKIQKLTTNILQYNINTGSYNVILNGKENEEKK